jgi:putative transposase
MRKRRTHRSEFKARAAMEAISGHKTLQEIAAEHAIHPTQVSQWMRQLLDWASDLFTRREEDQGQVRRAGRGGRSVPTARAAADGAGVAQKILSCSDARQLHKLDDHDHSEPSVSRHCELLGLPRSTLYYRPTPVRQSTLRIMARIDRFYLKDPCSAARGSWGI